MKCITETATRVDIPPRQIVMSKVKCPNCSIEARQTFSEDHPFGDYDTHTEGLCCPKCGRIWVDQNVKNE